MSRATRSRRATLAGERPEWRPWLALYETAAASLADPAWDHAVAPLAERHGAGDAPLLAGTTLVVDPGAVARHVRALARSLERAPEARAVARHAETAGLTVLHAAVASDGAALDAVAAQVGAASGLVRTLAPFIAMPLLQACGRALASRVPPAWSAGYCPVCGAWPTLAEARGLEAARRFRCGRCGSDWHADWLACPYCGNRDHTLLGALVPADGAETRKVETCKRCLGYVKTLAALGPCPPEEVVLVDLETVALDIAAVEQGYHRPADLPVALGVRAEARAASRRGLLSWIR